MRTDSTLQNTWLPQLAAETLQGTSVLLSGKYLLGQKNKSDWAPIRGKHRKDQSVLHHPTHLVPFVLLSRNIGIQSVISILFLPITAQDTTVTDTGELPQLFHKCSGFLNIPGLD